MNKEFVGHLMTFEKKGAGEEIVDENVLLEVTSFEQNGDVEIAFNDRNERCYLKFPVQELLRHIALAKGDKP